MGERNQVELHGRLSTAGCTASLLLVYHGERPQAYAQNWLCTAGCARQAIRGDATLGSQLSTMTEEERAREGAHPLPEELPSDMAILERVPRPHPPSTVKVGRLFKEVSECLST